MGLRPTHDHEGRVASAGDGYTQEHRVPSLKNTVEGPAAVCDRAGVRRLRRRGRVEEEDQEEDVGGVGW
jgi:hypothetical protein